MPKREVAVEGPASAIPEMIEINIEALELGQFIRVKDLRPIPECRYLDDPEQVVVGILLKQIEEVAPAPAVAAPAEPEVIGKKPSEEEAAEAEGKEAEGKKEKEKKEKE